MRPYIFALFLFLYSYVSAVAQQPVHWTYLAIPMPDGEYHILIHASIERPWHIYGTSVPEGVVSLPTIITFKSSPLLRLNGKIKTEYRAAGYEFENEVTFEQDVQVNANVKMNISGEVTFMACTNELCLPPITLPFSLSLNPTSKKAS